jgi:hypothetical protein
MRGGSRGTTGDLPAIFTPPAFIYSEIKKYLYFLFGAVVVLFPSMMVQIKGFIF